MPQKSNVQGMSQVGNLLPEESGLECTTIRVVRSNQVKAARIPHGKDDDISPEGAPTGEVVPIRV
jgi:hypothetical protein